MGRRRHERKGAATTGDTAAPIPLDPIDLLAGLAECVARAKADQGVRCVIVTGRGNTDKPARNARIFAGVGTASALIHCTAATSFTIRNISATGMWTSVEAG